MKILAVDCGGSRSSAIAVRDGVLEGEPLRGDAGNAASGGPERLAGVAQEFLRAIPDVEAVALAAAGIRTQADREAVVAEVRRAGIGLPVTLFSDAEVVLRAAGEQSGIALIAGTGSVAVAVDEDGQTSRAGGWGFLWGDEGGAFWLVTNLLRQLLRRYDEGEMPADMSRLLADLMQEAGAESPEGLRRVLREPDVVSRMARLLPLVASEANTEVRLVQGQKLMAARELARLVRVAEGSPHGATRQPGERPDIDRGWASAGLEGGKTVVVCSGGMFRAFPGLIAEVAEELGDGYACRELTVDPAWGAYWLAVERGEWIEGSDASAVPATEARNERLPDLASFSTLAMLQAINEEDAGVARAVQAALPMLADLVDGVAERLGEGGRLIYVGAGTSGRLAVLDAAECVPTFGTEPEMVQALIAGGNEALTRAVEGAEDDRAAAARDVERLQVSERDAVVGISASGTAPYVLAALETARERGALTGMISCASNGEASGRLRGGEESGGEGMASSVAHGANDGHAGVDHVVLALVGPEVIAGSSRMKAGTAQKMMLNMLSTGVMVRLGRTHGNRMLHVRPTNAKLRLRAQRMVAELSGANEERARSALRATGWDVPRAALLLLTGESAEADALLKRFGPNFGAALEVARSARRSAE